MPPSASDITALAGYVTPAFGINNWGAFGGVNRNLFRLDVNDALKSSITGNDRVRFCQAVNQQMRTPVNTPRICQDTAVDHATAAYAGGSACTNSPTAFVLISTGDNRALNQENDELSAVLGVPNSRIYENDRRGIENSNGTYDDQVKSYPLSGFARDCREKMGVSAEVMSCAPGEKFVGSVTNTDTVIHSYSLNGAASVSVPANSFTFYVNTCYAGTANMVVGSLTRTLSVADTNGDGRVDFLIPSPCSDPTKLTQATCVAPAAWNEFTAQ
jgi:hypothetical protein